MLIARLMLIIIAFLGLPKSAFALQNCCIDLGGSMFDPGWEMCNTTEDCRVYNDACGKKTAANVKFGADSQKALCHPVLELPPICNGPCPASAPEANGVVCAPIEVPGKVPGSYTSSSFRICQLKPSSLSG
jgi:hypothetical protein